jgi:hypothetical protein
MDALLGNYAIIAFHALCYKQRHHRDGNLYAPADAAAPFLFKVGKAMFSNARCWVSRWICRQSGAHSAGGLTDAVDSMAAARPCPQRYLVWAACCIAIALKVTCAPFYSLRGLAWFASGNRLDTGQCQRSINGGVPVGGSDGLRRAGHQRLCVRKHVRCHVPVAASAVLLAQDCRFYNRVSGLGCCHSNVSRNCDINPRATHFDSVSSQPRYNVSTSRITGRVITLGLAEICAPPQNFSASR